MGGGWLFCGISGLLCQNYCLLTQLLAEAVTMEGWNRKTRDYHQKLNARIALQFAEQFRINNLKKWGTFKTAYLCFYWFNGSRIWTRNSWVWSHNSWIWTHNLSIWTHNLWIWTLNSWIWTRNPSIWIRSSWIGARNLSIWTYTFEFQIVLLSF